MGSYYLQVDIEQREHSSDMSPSRTSDFELGDPKLVDFLNEKEERLRFPAFDFEIGECLLTGWKERLTAQLMLWVNIFEQERCHSR